MILIMYELMLCHFLGDYVFQTDFLARTKGESWWHMLAHCVTYTTPFICFFGFDMRIVFLLFSHILIDSAKARYKKINYISDQLLHIGALAIYLM